MVRSDRPREPICGTWAPRSARLRANLGALCWKCAWHYATAPYRELQYVYNPRTPNTHCASFPLSFQVQKSNERLHIQRSIGMSSFGWMTLFMLRSFAFRIRTAVPCHTEPSDADGYTALLCPNDSIKIRVQSSHLSVLETFSP
jgi:hypothetical protein